MSQTASSQDARERFDALLDSVCEKNETGVLGVNGEPVAVMISPDDYQQLTQHQPRRTASADGCAILRRVQTRRTGVDPRRV